MPSIETLFALLACSALAGEGAAPDLSCGAPSQPAVQCMVTGFPACFEAETPSPDRGVFDGEPTEAPSASVSWVRGHTTTFVPAGFVPRDGTYDLLVHFHGAPTRMHPAFTASRFEHAVLVTVNLGVGSGAYEKRFAAPGSFAQFVDAMHHETVRRMPGAPMRLGRVALSSWSAGYGAIKQILAHPENHASVDAVLLADGLHAGFVDARARTIHPPRMAPFVSFAELAANGGKLMAIAHSSIRTTAYASTTETARYLIRSIGLEPERVDDRVGEMSVTSSVRRSGLRVQGFAGADASAHVDHLAHIDGTLLQQLRGWWEKE